MWGQSLGNFPHLWQKYEYCVPHLKGNADGCKSFGIFNVGNFQWE